MTRFNDIVKGGLFILKITLFTIIILLALKYNYFFLTFNFILSNKKQELSSNAP